MRMACGGVLPRSLLNISGSYLGSLLGRHQPPSPQCFERIKYIYRQQSADGFRVVINQVV
jgi:hypothetical protein